MDDGLERIVLVDTADNEIGTAPKLDGHRRGLLHRALSVIVRDGAGRLLLQKRQQGSTIRAGCGPTPVAATRARARPWRWRQGGVWPRRWASAARCGRC